MRWTVALLAVLLAAGCSATPPPGTDGDLTDDSATLGTPAPFRPPVGHCHEAVAITAALDDYRPVDCAELHVSETYHVGTAVSATADVVPAAPTPLSVTADYRACSGRRDGSARVGSPAARPPGT